MVNSALTRSGRSAAATGPPGYREVFEASPTPMWLVLAADLAVLDANRAARTLLGPSAEPLHSLTLLLLDDPVPAADRQSGEEPGPAPGQRRRRCSQVTADGTVADLLLTGAPVTVGGREAVLVAAEDVTDTRQLQDRLREIQQLAHLGSWEFDVATGVVEWSDELYRIYGLPPGSVTGYESYVRRVHPEDRPVAEELVRMALESGHPFAAEYRIVRDADGEVRWLHSRGRVVHDADGRPLRMLGTCQDVTEQKLAQQALSHRALHDALTGLSNRELFLARLEQALRRLDRRDAVVGVLFVDLDGFKAVNDTAGHAVGDEILLAVARRLGSVVRSEDTIARFGGDEFTILCEDLDEAGISAVAERVLEVMAEPIQVLGAVMALSASVGVSLATRAGTLPDTMLREADAALYQAKRRGRNRCEVFGESVRERAESAARATEDLRQALDGGELRVVFQPIVGLHDASTGGVEALVRWAHPERGLIGPADFIPLAEETGLIVPLGAWVLREACHEVAIRSRALGREMSVSVNLSARQLATAALVDTVCDALRESGLHPRQLCLEITESVLMDDVERSIEALLGLKALGVTLAVDDFGTGYSSLSYLRRFPLDVVKVDRSFVAELGVDAAADAIVAAVVNLSRALGLKVVAEGVETEEHLLALRALGCEHAQGFYWSPPLSAPDLSAWLERPTGQALPAVPTDVGGLLAQRAEALRAATGRAVVVQVPGNLGAVLGDPAAVRTILDHLLGNAAKYSPPDRPVLVAAASDRRWVRVSVTDYGLGMTGEESARCFEPFWQATRAGGGTGTGTGMGLYIVRSLVEAMAGHVGVRSARGKGSTFTFALPRSGRAAQRVRRPAGDRGALGADTSIREFMRQIGVPSRRGA